MDFATIGSLALTGVVVSLFVQYTKGWLTNSAYKVLYTVALSVVAGLGVYYFHLIPTNVVQTFLGVWVAANSAYVVITRWLNN